MQKRNAEIDEPYSLALYALANFAANQKAEAEKTVARLRGLGKKRVIEFIGSWKRIHRFTVGELPAESRQLL